MFPSHGAEIKGWQAVGFPAYCVEAQATWVWAGEVGGLHQVPGAGVACQHGGRPGGAQGPESPLPCLSPCRVEQGLRPVSLEPGPWGSGVEGPPDPAWHAAFPPPPRHVTLSCFVCCVSPSPPINGRVLGPTTLKVRVHLAPSAPGRLQLPFPFHFQDSVTRQQEPWARVRELGQPPPLP